MQEIIIDKKHIDFTTMRHVSLAVAKDGSRPALQHIHIEGNIAYGCDGYRLHYAPVTHFSDGLYFLVGTSKGKVVLHKSENDLMYPDVRQVIPINSTLLATINDTSSITLSLVLAKISNNKSNDKTIYSVNYPYLVDATECYNKNRIDGIEISIDVSAILIKGDVFSAIVYLLHIPAV